MIVIHNLHFISGISFIFQKLLKTRKHGTSIQYKLGQITHIICQEPSVWIVTPVLCSYMLFIRHWKTMT